MLLYSSVFHIVKRVKDSNMINVSIFFEHKQCHSVTTIYKSISIGQIQYN